MTEHERSRLADEFLGFIGTMMRGTRAIFRRELEACDMTWPQFSLLKVVKKHSGRMTVTELSNSLMVAPPTGSRMIEGLCSKGLLAKEKDPDDHRVTLVVLTEKSRGLMDKLIELQSQVMSEVLEGEDTRELARNMKSLKRIADKWLAVAEKKARKGEKT